MRASLHRVVVAIFAVSLFTYTMCVKHKIVVIDAGDKSKTCYLVDLPALTRGETCPSIRPDECPYTTKDTNEKFFVCVSRSTPYYVKAGYVDASNIQDSDLKALGCSKFKASNSDAPRDLGRVRNLLIV